MEAIKNFIHRINQNIILRSIILAVCALILLTFTIQIALNLITRHGEVYEVPDFSSLSLDEAQQAARGADLVLEVIDSIYMPQFKGGAVIEQKPTAGSKVKSGRRIFLVVNSSEQVKAQIPYVAGYSLRQAKNILITAGFEVAELHYTDDIATNNVLSQSYNGTNITEGSDIEAPVGSGITLTVGRSADASGPIVPKVIGYSLREAKSRIWEQGLNVGRVTYDDDITPFNMMQAKVSRQSPARGAAVEFGSRVELHLTLDEEAIGKNSMESERNYRSMMEKKQQEKADSLAAAPTETPANTHEE